MIKRQQLPKLRVYSVMLVAFSFLVNVAIVNGNYDVNTRGMVFGLMWLLWSALPVAALSYAAKRSAVESRQAAQAWGMLAFGQLVLVVIHLMVLGIKLDPGLPEWLIYGGVLCYYPLTLLGILSLPAKRQPPVAWWKTALDLAIVLLTAALVVWNFWPRSVMASAGVEQLEAQLFALAYPVGHLVLLWALLLLLHRRKAGQPAAPLYLMVLGVGVSLVSDFNFGHQSVLGTYTEGGLA